MKIAIPAEKKSDDTKICISFGRTPYFLIFDTDTKEKSFLENTAATSQGGAGIKAAQSIIDNGAKAVLTPRCGENAANVFKVANVKLYKTKNDSMDENIEAFLNDGLEVLSDVHPGFHGKHGD